MLYNAADGVLDFVRVFSVDIVLSNGDGVVRWIAVFRDTVTRGQHPILAQDGAAACRERVGPWDASD